VLIYIFIAIIFISAVLIPFVKAEHKSTLAIAGVAGIVIFSSIFAIQSLTGSIFELTLSGSLVTGAIPLKIDTLSAWFILTINFTFLTGVIYGKGYMRPYHDQLGNLSLHWISYLLNHVSLLIICVIQNSLAFLIAWEIMSFTSLILIIFDFKQQKTLQAGINFLVQMHIAVVFLTIGFIWAYSSTGTFSFEGIRQFFQSRSSVFPFLLFFAGFGIKAGFIPFHSWLPYAHPASPSHVSGIMSGIIVKIGIFGILRMITLLIHDFLILGEVIFTVSILTGLFGILNAAVHRDFKKMLAYCTIENIGIIGTGIGLGLIGLGLNNQLMIIFGFGSALLHTLNHSLFKSLLFYAAGSVYQQTHTKDMEKLGGLIKQMPQTALLFLIGAIAVAGLPPLNGFVSEFVLYKGLLTGVISSDFYHTTLTVLGLAGLAIIGGASLHTFTKTFGTVFLGSPRIKLHQTPTEVNWLMRIPQFAIVLAILSIGIFPSAFFNVATSTVSSSFIQSGFSNPEILGSVSKTLTGVGRYSLVLLFLIGLVFILRNAFKRESVKTLPTWGCGYVAPKTTMQYTGKSFTKTLGKMLSFMVIENKKYEEIKPSVVFAEHRKHSSHYIDFFETRIINRITQALTNSLNLFQFVQNGKMQQYILYGLIFIIAILLATIYQLV